MPSGGGCIMPPPTCLLLSRRNVRMCHLPWRRGLGSDPGKDFEVGGGPGSHRPAHVLPAVLGGGRQGVRGWRGLAARRAGKGPGRGDTDWLLSLPGGTQPRQPLLAARTTAFVLVLSGGLGGGVLQRQQEPHTAFRGAGGLPWSGGGEAWLSPSEPPGRTAGVGEGPSPSSGSAQHCPFVCDSAKETGDTAPKSRAPFVKVPLV